MTISLRSGFVVVVGIFAAATSFAACAASGNSSKIGSGGGSTSGGSAGQGAGGSGTGGGIATGGTGGGISLDGSSSGGSGGLTDGGACTGQTTKSSRLPLDMYVMMDISGSMTETVSSGQTKWAAVKGAMTGFLKDPNSQGLGVGIQYFPLLNPNVPNTCTSNANCGAGGLCVLNTCDNTGGFVVPCSTTADCSANNQGNCVPLGVNCLDQTQLCAPGGNKCTPLGGCVKITQSYCNNQTSCLVGDYAKPAVEIYTLGSPTKIVNSMNAQTPNGETPTGPALQGAINHATTWGKAHPTHTVVVVMATDGIPTQCSPTDINQVAQIAAKGVSATPSIDTFVIGVFGPNDTTSQSNLDTIAKGGGTGKAFIVDTSGNVSQQFTDALNKIRGQALSCDFAIPAPPDGGTLDYQKVNVSYTSGGTTQKLYYVEDKSQCDPNTGGWYYDNDPAEGGTPTKIIVCSKNCADFQATTTTTQQVDVQLGCKTVIKPPA